LPISRPAAGWRPNCPAPASRPVPPVLSGRDQASPTPSISNPRGSARIGKLDWHASATAVPPHGLRPTHVLKPPCESALTSARSHLFRLVCDQAQAWATPEAKSRTGSPGPESVRYDAIMAIAWCPIGDAKPAPEPADRKRVGGWLGVGAGPPVFDAAAVHAGPSCGADPGSAGARHRRSFRRALERGSATRHSARRRHCALNVVYRSRAHG
jgi:hypothetical protein